MVLWAVFSASTAFVRGPTDFYILRFLLGAAESGFFPGMMYYLSLWFPAAYRARLAAIIIVGNPVAFIFGGPMSTLLLDMDGIAGFHGWRWLFRIEGAPVLLLAVAVLKLLPDGPKLAPFLTSTEKDFIAARLAEEDGSKPAQTGAAFRDARIFALALVLFAILGVGYGLLLWLPQIVQAMGFLNREVGFITALPAGAAAAAMVWWGRSSDVSGERVWHLTLAMLFGAGGICRDGRFALEPHPIVRAQCCFRRRVLHPAHCPQPSRNVSPWQCRRGGAGHLQYDRPVWRLCCPLHYRHYEGAVGQLCGRDDDQCRRTWHWRAHRVGA
jgi:MFS transporter, ACS family, tartrate transporter